MSVKTTVLDNGVTILTQEIPHVRSASVGIFSKCGSVFEKKGEEGISHFIEHMFFKGTERRSSEQLAKEIEGKGGMLNAYTSNENTAYYVRVLDTQVRQAIDVLADMYMNSKFDEEDVDTERSVILEEIARMKDDSESYVHTLFQANRWQNHPLGHPVIGYEETVSAFDSLDMVEYIYRNYTGPNTLVSVAGNINCDEVVQQIKTLLGSLPSKVVSAPYDKLPEASMEDIYIEWETQQAHFAIGCEGPSFTDERRFAFGLLNTALGGGMSSRLFQEIREKRGLAYSVGSYHAKFRDIGAVVAYGGTNVKNLDSVREIITEQVADVRANGLGEEELQTMKDTDIGATTLGLETPQAIMVHNAYSVLKYGRPITIDEIINKVNAVTNEDIIEAANAFLVPERFSSVVIGPTR